MGNQSGISMKERLKTARIASWSAEFGIVVLTHFCQIGLHPFLRVERIKVKELRETTSNDPTGIISHCGICPSGGFLIARND